MATVTAFTAERSLAIENKRIDSAAIVNDELILTCKDATQINAGNVRGAQGIQGIQGPQGDSTIPPGTIIAGGWGADPSGYLILDGRQVAVASFPNVASVFPGWVSGGTIYLPNMNGSVLMGASVPGTLSGSMSHTLSEANIPSHRHSGPSHRHSIAHGHSDTFATSGGNHAHPASTPLTGNNSQPYYFYSRVGTSGNNYDWYGGGTLTQWAAYASPPTTSANANVSLVGSVTPANASNYSGYDGTGLTGAVGSNVAVNHTPRNLGVRYAVKT